MDISLCTTFLLIVVQLILIVDGRKNANNIPSPNGSERVFRSARVQQVWEKANRMEIESVKLTDLYADLKHHDMLMMEHKQSKVNRADDDGVKEAELTEGLHTIMMKYGIGGKKKPTVDPNMKRKLHSNRFLEDPKLEKLWQTANKHGKFTQEELESLHLEFTHHRKKVEEYEILSSEASKVDEMSDNLVEKQLVLEEHGKRKEKMAEMYEEIMEGYERLNLKTKQGTLNGASVPFTEPRVADLWEEAKKGNFTEQELESIKQELHHFQTRVQKHLFFRDQLKNAAEKVDYHGGKENSPTQHVETHDHLQNKVQNLAAKVKKLHHELTQKLSSGINSHREL